MTDHRDGIVKDSWNMAAAGNATFILDRNVLIFLVKHENIGKYKTDNGVKAYGMAIYMDVAEDEPRVRVTLLSRKNFEILSDKYLHHIISLEEVAEKFHIIHASTRH